MEELKKKCHTDDDSSYHWWKISSIWFVICNCLALWLDHSKTLRQQDIDEQSIVVLRRKYFFSDNDIDQRDPIQLNLLYIQVKKSSRNVRINSHSFIFQCRNGILDGTHPVTYDEAVQFAGLQCQIQFNDYQESKHKSNALE